MTNAIQRGDAAEALRQLGLALESGGVSYQILGQLAWFVREKLPVIGSAAGAGGDRGAVPDGSGAEELRGRPGSCSSGSSCELCRALTCFATRLARRDL